MAYKIVLSSRFSKKLIRLFFYLERNYSMEVTKRLVEKIDLKIIQLSHRPGTGLSSSKIPGVHKISISRHNKLYYRIKGRKIIMLDLLQAGLTSKE